MAPHNTEPPEHSPLASSSKPSSRHPTPTPSTASTSASPLPSLLLGLRSTSTRSRPAVSLTSSTSEPPPARVATASPSKSHRAPSTLHRSISNASLAPPHLTLPHVTAPTTTTTAALSDALEQSNLEAGDDEADDSDDSSGFASLLQRVGVNGPGSVSSSGRATPAGAAPRKKSDKAKGKERAMDSLGSGISGPVGSLLDEEVGDSGSSISESVPEGRPELITAEHEAEVELESDEDGEVDFVGREEGQPDPRDMLRAQLRRNDSAGRLGRISRSASLGAVALEETEGTTEDASAVVRSRYSPRRYFILSSAGKLIFTTDPDEEEATGYVGVMQAIISIFADEGDKLRYVDAGATRIAFVLKAPIYLACVSDWGEPESVLRTHLDYLHYQILSIVTLSQLTAIFSKRSNFDLRRLMEGTEGFFTSLVGRLQTSLAILTSCLEVYRVDPAVREDVSKALTPHKSKSQNQAQSLSLLYALVISHSRVVTLLRPTKHSIHPTDLHILLSTIYSSTTFRTPDSESWIPICLPRFNNKGFLHAYISFLTDGTGIVLISAQRDAFEGVKKYGEEIKTRLRDQGLVHRLEMARGVQNYSLGELAIPGLRHFLYKSRSYVQITHPAYEGDYEVEDNKLRLITLYQRIHEAIHARSAIAGNPARAPAKLMYLRTEHEAVLGWTTSSFELYLAVSPLLPKTAVVSAARAITRWIRTEDSRLFLTSAPSF